MEYEILIDENNNGILEWEAISPLEILVKNVEIYLDWAYYMLDSSAEPTIIKSTIVCSNILFKSEVDSYYSPEETYVESLKDEVKLRYGIRNNSLLARWGIFRLNGKKFTYPQQLTAYVTQKDYEELIIEERNNIIDQILK
jgi:hypothetical protein